MSLKRFTLVFLLSVALAFVAYFILPIFLIAQLNNRYEQTQHGMKLPDVCTLMGSPGTRSSAPCQYPAWDEQPLSTETAENIAFTLRYTVGTFYLPVTYEFAFDSNEQLIGRHIYD